MGHWYVLFSLFLRSIYIYISSNEHHAICWLFAYEVWVLKTLFLAENDTSVMHCFLYTVLGCILIYFMRQNRATDIPHLSLLPGHHGHWRTFSRSIREAQTCTSEVSAGSVPFFWGAGVQVKDGWRYTWWNCGKYCRQHILCRVSPAGWCCIYCCHLGMCGTSSGAGRWRLCLSHVPWNINIKKAEHIALEEDTE